MFAHTHFSRLFSRLCIGTFIITITSLAACAAPSAPAAAPAKSAVAIPVNAATEAPAAYASLSIEAAKPTEAPKVEMPASAPAAAPAAPGQAIAPIPAAPLATRLIIRNAEVVIVVHDVMSVVSTINRMAGEYRGYVVSSSIDQQQFATQAQISIRVDPNQLDSVLKRIHDLALRVQLENVHGEDVSAEYIDLQSRVRNLEATEIQLKDILKKAKDTQDVLTVYNQIVQVRGEIEQAKGRMKYLAELSALATVNVTVLSDVQPTPTPTPTLTPTPTPTSTPTPTPVWDPGKTLNGAGVELNQRMQKTADSAIWLFLVTLPSILVWLLPILALLWIGRAIWRRVNSGRWRLPITKPDHDQQPKSGN